MLIATIFKRVLDLEGVAHPCWGILRLTNTSQAISSGSIHQIKALELATPICKTLFYIHIRTFVKVKDSKLRHYIIIAMIF